MHPSLRILPRDQDVVASRAVAGAGRTAEGDRLSTLQDCTPAHGPASEQGVRNPAAVRHVAFASTERKLVAAAQVDDIANIERSQAVVVLNSGARNIWSPETSRTPAVKQIAGIGARLRPGVGRQETQTIGELFFRLGLKGMIVTVPVGGGVAVVLPEIGEWDAALRRRSGGEAGVHGQNLSGSVGAGEHLQMPRQRGHISGLHAEGRRYLILQRQVTAHGVRSLVVELDAAQRQASGH